MKSCSYCGREGDDDLVACQECGTEFTAAEPEAEPKPPYDFTWLRKALFLAASACCFMFLYFMSLGPATRLFVDPPIRTVTSNASGYAVMTWQKTPAWMHFLYYPAYYGGMELEAYRKYVAMWEKPAVQLTPVAWTNFTTTVRTTTSGWSSEK